MWYNVDDPRKLRNMKIKTIVAFVVTLVLIGGVVLLTWKLNYTDLSSYSGEGK